MTVRKPILVLTADPNCRRCQITPGLLISRAEYERTETMYARETTRTTRVCDCVKAVDLWDLLTVPLEPDSPNGRTLFDHLIQDEMPKNVPNILTRHPEWQCEGEKRQNAPYTLTAKCPKCGERIERDFRTDYLSYPVFGTIEDLGMYCHSCEHEWVIPVKVDIILELADE